MDLDARLSVGEIVVQAQVRIVVALLKMARDLLQGAQTALPLSAQELDRDADLGAKPDVTSEVRRVIEVVIADLLNPAIAYLTTAAEYRVGEQPSP